MSPDVPAQGFPPHVPATLVSGTDNIIRGGFSSNTTFVNSTEGLTAVFVTSVSNPSHVQLYSRLWQINRMNNQTFKIRCNNEIVYQSIRRYSVLFQTQ